MSELTIITQSRCGWCDKARELLTEHGHTYRNVPLGDSGTRTLFVAAYPELRTVPQIFLDEYTLIGGYTDLEKLVVDGQLVLPPPAEDTEEPQDIVSYRYAFWRYVNQTYPQQGK